MRFVDLGEVYWHGTASQGLEGPNPDQNVSSGFDRYPYIMPGIIKSCEIFTDDILGEFFEFRVVFLLMF